MTKDEFYSARKTATKIDYSFLLDGEVHHLPLNGRKAPTLQKAVLASTKKLGWIVKTKIIDGELYAVYEGERVKRYQRRADGKLWDVNRNIDYSYLSDNQKHEIPLNGRKVTTAQKSLLCTAKRNGWVVRTGIVEGKLYAMRVK